MGVVIILGLVLVYCAGNLGVFRFYRGERRNEFRPLLHAVFPLVSSIALIWVGYASVVPLPEAPICYAPFIVLGWLVLGILLLGVMKYTGRESWILKAGQVACERGTLDGSQEKKDDPATIGDTGTEVNR